MIELKDFAELINNEINALLEASDLNTENRNYVFRIVADTSDYKAPTRQGNTVTYYIQGNLSQVSSDIQTTNTGSTDNSQKNYNAELQSYMQIVVPIIRTESGEEDENGNKEIVTTMRQILDTYFSENDTGNISDGTITYYYGVQYSLIESGIREKLPYIGDCFSMSASINYYILQAGINSNAALISIDGYLAGWTLSGLMREMQNQGNVPSDTTTGSAQNIETGNILTINMDIPATLSPLFDIFTDYTLNGNNPARLVTVTMPSYANTTITKNFLMMFQSITHNMSTVNFMSLSITLIEAMNISGLTQLSGPAQEVFGNGAV